MTPPEAFFSFGVHFCTDKGVLSAAYSIFPWCVDVARFFSLLRGEKFSHKLHSLSLNYSPDAYGNVLSVLRSRWDLSSSSFNHTDHLC